MDFHKIRYRWLLFLRSPVKIFQIWLNSKKKIRQFTRPPEEVYRHRRHKFATKAFVWVIRYLHIVDSYVQLNNTRKRHCYNFHYKSGHVNTPQCNSTCTLWCSIHERPDPAVFIIGVFPSRCSLNVCLPIRIAVILNNSRVQSVTCGPCTAYTASLQGRTAVAVCSELCRPVERTYTQRG